MNSYLIPVIFMLFTIIGSSGLVQFQFMNSAKKCLFICFDSKTDGERKTTKNGFI